MGFDVRIIQDGLSEKEAFELEYQTIQHYVFDLGYAINIAGYRDISNPKFLTNATFGGAGLRDLKRPEHSTLMSGENNPMYGVNVWDSYSAEKAEEVREKLSKSFSGKSNPMYGISPQERMSEDKYQEWLQKTWHRLSNQQGDKNPNSKKIYMYDKDRNFVKDFSCIKECALWLQSDLGFTSSLANIANLVGRSANHNVPYKGYWFYFKKI